MKGRVLLCLGVLVIATVSACGREAPSASPPPAVSVMEAIEKEILEWDEYIGRLESPETVEVRARVSGYLDQVHFREGTEVKKGDLLFTIDPRPYRAVYERVKAEHERALTEAALAKNDADRAARLIKTKVIPEEEYDTKSKSWEAAVAAAKSAGAAMESARLDLEFTAVRAPIDGRISRALVTAGNLVSAGMNGGGATLLTTIVSLDPLYLYGDADENAILKYIQLSREGKRDSARDQIIPAEMGLANEEGFPHKGFMDFVDNRIDPNTGTMRARGVFANEDHRLAPGFFARIRIPGSGLYPAVLVLDRAMGQDQSQKFVYVVGAGNAVQYRPVTTGPLIDGMRVIKSGLAPGERVIVEGQIRVRPGVVVDPKPWAAAPATAP